MKPKLTSLVRQSCCALMLASVLGAAQARGTVLLIEPPRVQLLNAEGKAPSVEAMRIAIVRAASQRQWTPREDKPGEITLVFNKQNKHEVVVRISYDAGSYQISYVSSTNMKYELENGQAQIHPFYNKWVANLSSDITAQVQQSR
ncbi:hypothetical protein ACG0Z6_00565 [Roseateles sp. BYS180W]|uniref:Lipoprotein n=1 Tax=Roseateles rivi TaxID=3299028 RepID=A0ABW7FQZ8_9BURK